MININLKPGIKRQAARGPAFAGFGASFKGLATRFKDPGLALAVGAWVLVLGFLGYTYIHTGSQLNELAPQLQQRSAEFRRYSNFVRDKHHEEKIRDSVLTQIGTIAAVDQDRFTWSHILDEVSGALPDYTWLTEIATIPAPPDADVDSTGAAPVNLRIVGRTSDLQNYTAFLRRLDASPFLTNVLPIEAKTVIEKNRPLTAFTIQATFSHADSTHVHTVPILESTVKP